jgi:hypothetical protein
MKVYRRRRGITTLILELGTWQRWVVNLLLSCCTSGEGAHSAHLTGGWVGHRAGLVILGRKIFFPAGNTTPDHPACSLVTILTVLLQWQEGGGTALFYLFSEDWESGFLWNVANHLPECVESFTCRSQFKSCKPKIHKNLNPYNCELYIIFMSNYHYLSSSLQIGIWFFWWFFLIPTSCIQWVVLCACITFMFLTVFTRAHNWRLP